MPRLPDYTDLGARPEPSVGRVPRNQTSPSRAGEIEGRALSGLGDTMDAIDREMERIDNLRAEDAFNKMREKQLELSIGEDGFTKRKGSDAINPSLFKDYEGKFKSAEESISSKLTNERQREFFKKRSAVSALEFKQGMLNHVTREKDAYSKEVFESTIKLESNNAVDRHTDKAAVALSRTRIDEAINKEAEREKWSPEQVTLTKQTVASNIHRGTIMRMLANDDDLSAMAYFQRNKAEIHGDELQSVEQALAVGSTRGESQRQADAIVARSNGDLGIALTEARKISNPRVREATVNQVKSMIAEDEAARKMAKDRVHTSALEYVDKYGSVDKIPPEIYVQLSKDDLNVLDSLAKRGNVAAEKNDDNLWIDFSQKSRDRKWLSGLNDLEFGKYLMKFDEPHQERASALRDAAIEAASDDAAAAAKASEFLRNDVNLGEMTKAKMITAGLLSPTKKPSKYSEEEKTLLSEIEVKASKALEDFQVKNKRKATTDEEEEVVRKLLLPYTKVRVERNWLPDATKNLSELTAEDISKAYVEFDKIPAEEREYLMNRAKSMGSTPNEDAIAKAYTVLITSGNLPAADRRARIDAILRGK